MTFQESHANQGVGGSQSVLITSYVIDASNMFKMRNRIATNTTQAFS